MTNAEVVTPDGKPSIDRGQMFVGIVVMLVGFTLLLERADIIEVRLWSFWSFLIIAMGIKRLLEPPRFGIRRGWFLVLIGTLLALDQFRVVSIHETWPLLIVGFGAGLISRALLRPPRTGQMS